MFTPRINNTHVGIQWRIEVKKVSSRTDASLRIILPLDLSRLALTTPDLVKKNGREYGNNNDNGNDNAVGCARRLV